MSPLPRKIVAMLFCSSVALFPAPIHSQKTNITENSTTNFTAQTTPEPMNNNNETEILVIASVIFGILFVSYLRPCLKYLEKIPKKRAIAQDPAPLSDINILGSV